MREYLINALRSYGELHKNAQLYRFYYGLVSKIYNNENEYIWSFILSLSKQNDTLLETIVKLHTQSIFPVLGVKNDE